MNEEGAPELEVEVKMLQVVFIIGFEPDSTEGGRSEVRGEQGRHMQAPSSRLILMMVLRIDHQFLVLSWG
jgi:hypothetical protein